MITRRKTLGATLSAGGMTLLGCGAGDDSAEAMTLAQPDAPSAPESATTTAYPVTGQAVARTPSSGRYRSDHHYLFQSIGASEIRPRIGGGAFNMERWGPTAQFVDFRTKWPWTRTGGDWIDADGVRHGTRPWASVAATLARGADVTATYHLDVTQLVRKVQSAGRWCALLLTSAPAVRPIAGLQQTEFPRPAIDVRYTNGTNAVLNCRIVARAGTGSVAPQTTGPKMALPAFLEFERPSSPVAKATLRFVVLSHHTNVNNPTLRVFLLDPPLNNTAVRRGVADTAQSLDVGLEQHDAIIGVHRYLDGVPWSEFIDGKGGISTSGERSFDPAIWGPVPSDTSKLPHRSLGKWIATGENWSKVESSYTSEGFRPLAPGLGAVRIAMPRREDLSNGDVVGFGGTLGTSAYLYMPEPLFGRLGRIFVRHYFRLGTPNGGAYSRRQAERYQVRNTPDKVAWVDHAGKFGLMPEHATTFGGVSGSAGGGRGWQMRMAWSDCDAEQGGPDEGGIASGLHLWDFQHNNPPGHRYANLQSAFGQIGGLGGILYAHHWYCLESEVKLNSVDKPAVLADGSPHVINGVRQYWSPDGEIRHWVDGRLVFEQTGMVFRSLPLFDYTGRFDPAIMVRPCRELGVRGLWLNWFHGGVTPNAVDRVIFVTGIAWGHQYIGPMRL